jgi:hypothetical protein
MGLLYRHRLTAAASMAAPTDSTISVGPSKEEQAAQPEETLAGVGSGVCMSDAYDETDSTSVMSTSLASSAKTTRSRMVVGITGFTKGAISFRTTTGRTERT